MRCHIIDANLARFVTAIGISNTAYISKLSINWLMPHSAKTLWLFPNLQYLELFGVCNSFKPWRILGQCHLICRPPYKVVNTLARHCPSICTSGLKNLIRSQLVAVDLIFWPIMFCSCDSCVESCPKFWDEVAQDGEYASEARCRWNFACGALMDSLRKIENPFSGE